MSNELHVIDESTITIELKSEINEDIDRIIEVHKNNRQAINKLVFESVAAMTEADDAQAELSNKGWLKRRIGSITGSNSRLQDRINSNRAAAMYASQQTLQRLAEQNLMTFDLIAAVNNKLNASLIKVDEEFANIYEGLAKFFKTNRSELARLEARIEKMERNLRLLNWQNSIEYQEFNGVEYADLDEASKIVCLVRDFYDITKGEWSNSDLLLLKSAMKDIDISPKDTVNYFDVLKKISCNNDLKEHMLGNRPIKQIEEPGYLLSLGCIKKFDDLQNRESYLVDTIIGFMGSKGVGKNRDAVSSALTTKYLARKAYVDVNVDVECYDLILDLLYNIRQARDENILGFSKLCSAIELLELGDKYFNGEDVEENVEKAYHCYLEAATMGNTKAIYTIGAFYLGGVYVDKNLENALEWFLKGAELGDAEAMVMVGEFYDNGDGVEQSYEKALEWYTKAADLGNACAMQYIGEFYESGNILEQSYEKALGWYLKAAEYDDDVAMNNIGNLYYYGYGVQQDCNKAMEWYQKAADFGNKDALNKIEEINKRNHFGLIAPLEGELIFNDANRDIYPRVKRVFENLRVYISKQLHPNGKVIFNNCEIIFDWDGKTALYAEEPSSEIVFKHCEFKTRKTTKMSMVDFCGKCTFQNCLFSSLDYISGSHQSSSNSSVYHNHAFINPDGNAVLTMEHCCIKDCKGAFVGAFSSDSSVIIKDCLVENHCGNFLQSWGTYKYLKEDVESNSVEIVDTIFEGGRNTPDASYLRMIACSNELPYVSLIEAEKYRKVVCNGCDFKNLEQQIFEFIDCEDFIPMITGCKFTNCKEIDKQVGRFINCKFGDG